MIYLDKWIHIKYQNWHINYVMTIFWLSSTSVWKLRLKNSHEQKMFLFRCMDLSFWVNLVSNFLSKLCNVTTIFKSVKSFRTFFKQCINFFILKLLCPICGGEVEVILLIKPNRNGGLIALLTAFPNHIYSSKKVLPSIHCQNTMICIVWLPVFQIQHLPFFVAHRPKNGWSFFILFCAFGYFIVKNTKIKLIADWNCCKITWISCKNKVASWILRGTNKQI